MTAHHSRTGHSARLLRATAAAAVLAGLLAVPVSGLGAADAPPASRTLALPGGASAVVTTAPFGLTVRDQTGRTVLRSAPATGGPQPGLTWTQAPLGSTVAPQLSRYAPITFEVGTATAAQFPASQYQGNLLAGAQLGIDYASTNVTSISAEGAGWSMTVGTDDPSGRAVEVDLRPGPVSGTVELSAALSSPTNVVSLSTSFVSAADEAFHGFGGRHDGVDQHGQQLTQWTQEENQSAGPASGLVALLPGTGGSAYLFPNGPTAAYYVQNTFVSSHGYGFGLLRPATVVVPARLRPPRRLAGQRRRLRHPRSDRTGGARPPQSRTDRDHRAPERPAAAGPKGTLLYRGVKSLIAPDTAATYLAKVHDDIAQIDADHLTISAYDIEGWSLLAPADLARLYRGVEGPRDPSDGLRARLRQQRRRRNRTRRRLGLRAQPRPARHQRRRRAPTCSDHRSSSARPASSTSPTRPPLPGTNRESPHCWTRASTGS